MAKIKIDQKKCIQCGACVAICQPEIFVQLDEEIQIESEENCFQCGHCVALCPTDAIDHERFPLASMPLLNEMPEIGVDQVISLLRGRRSSRIFQDKKVPSEILTDLLDCTRWAPSASNEQNVEWLVIDNAEDILDLSKKAVDSLAKLANLVRNPIVRLGLRFIYGVEILEKAVNSVSQLEIAEDQLAAGDNPLLFNAPVVLVAHVPKSNYFGRDDSIYAAYNLMLTAQKMGLGTCQIGYFTVALDRSKKLRNFLGLPAGRKPEVVLVLGYSKYKFLRGIDRNVRKMQAYKKK
ncbi:MAG: nitroreductase family protein [Anaerolineaceae bacterium]|nr:nitroreductase family protein [Anaerolineaceae bacterium]